MSSNRHCLIPRNLYQFLFRQNTDTHTIIMDNFPHPFWFPFSFSFISFFIILVRLILSSYVVFSFFIYLSVVHSLKQVRGESMVRTEVPACAHFLHLGHCHLLIPIPLKLPTRNTASILLIYLFLCNILLAYSETLRATSIIPNRRPAVVPAHLLQLGYYQRQSGYLQNSILNCSAFFSYYVAFLKTNSFNR